MRVGDGTIKVMVRKRTLKRYKENVEEQKEVLNDRQQCTETSGNKKVQEIPYPRSCSQHCLEFLPRQSFLLGQLLPAQIEDVAQGSYDRSMQLLLPLTPHIIVWSRAGS